MTTSSDIPILHGQLPSPGSKEYVEFQNCESGKADEEVRRQFGNGPDRWLSAVKQHEPHSIPALRYLVNHPKVSRFVRGRVLDCGAGSCWLSAEVSRLPDLEEVTAFDLSEKFLRGAGLELFQQQGGHTEKLRFASGSFNGMPFPDASFDCAFLFAVVHHSLAPISLLSESLRVLKPTGALFVLESPLPAWRLEEGRRWSLEISSSATEIALTYADLLYYFRMARAGSIACYPLDCVTRGRRRLWMRRALRRLGWENFLKPPTTIFMLKKG